ncbi:putative trehalase [Suhomyces tanzawaensis NRRL Y-17324]|uniref:carnosine N-methyltransferase n=1 Tax=Suhomyces tanzawaensis NRRL Y-17324 TaxID=984487 RepID=A0A1E4SL93_9ASCO|nr:putative trehalase [Suhomyces tanzawaensis NRRL Y-17324]ODV80273.1 putative trehalase [Suhomyces tanzawaensis NRRL Y-17324]
MSQDIEEYKALTSTLLAFYNFHKWEFEQLIKTRTIKYNSLTAEERELIPWYLQHIEDLKQCIGINQEFTQNLAIAISKDWGVSPDPSGWEPATTNEYDKVRSTLLQFAREWSSDGVPEITVSHFKIIEELEQIYPNLEERQNVKILNPGCGLGRLVLELVKKGFWCQGNEFSYHMLLASNFILNHCTFAHNYSIFPYLHKASHLVKRLNQIRPVTIPDCSPTEIHELSTKNPTIPYQELMSMTAGSFVDLYGPENLTELDTYSKDPIANDFRTTNENNFDVLVTTFFLDTASNIIDYLKTFHYCLKPGGTWINFGPLLWHFEDDQNMLYIQRRDGDTYQKVPSIMTGLELSRDDLIALIEKMGFDFEKRESGIETSYSGDIKALGSFVYKCEYWVCKKR